MVGKITANKGGLVSMPGTEQATMGNDMTATLLELAGQQIEFAREYTLSLIEDIDDDEWFAQPQGVTHLAWQIGHLAMAQYGLCLFRIRGRQEIDVELMSSRFRKQFSRGSQPKAMDSVSSPDEVRSVFDRVYAQVLLELPGFDASTLTAPIDKPYAVYPNKLGALFFCSAHEMLHAGQIGLLRRLLGKQPIR